MPASRGGLTEALAMRLCHDVAGLAGTIRGMLELSAEADDAAETLAVAREASRQLLGRVRLARAAWGGAADWADGALAILLDGLARDGARVVPDAATLALGRGPDLGRLLLNVALLGAETLRRSGEIHIRAEAPALIAATLSGPGAPEWPMPEQADLTHPARFQHGFTALLAHSNGISLRAEGPTLRIVLPA